MNNLFTKLSLIAILTVSANAFEVKFLKHKVQTNGNGVKVGKMAPSFKAVTNDLKEMKVGGAKKKIQIIAFVPSIDTGTCALEAMHFNKTIKEMKNVEVTIVSKDTPFAFDKFCKDKDIKNINTVSDYKGAKNALKYGSTIVTPVFLEGFFARTIYIVGTDGKVKYVQVVDQIADEPDYKAILKALKKVK